MCGGELDLEAWPECLEETQEGTRTLTRKPNGFFHYGNLLVDTILDCLH